MAMTDVWESRTGKELFDQGHMQTSSCLIDKAYL
jgi:hypothetical protein